MVESLEKISSENTAQDVQMKEKVQLFLLSITTAVQASVVESRE